jgi:hypothetical protein
MNNPIVVTQALRDLKASNPVADALFTDWALRQRARANVTMHGLEQRMKADGFAFDKQEYGKVLKFLAGLGLGRLDTDHKGRVRALKDVKTTLQSIGLAACGEKGAVVPFRQRNRFVKLVPKAAAPAEGTPVPATPKPQIQPVPMRRRRPKVVGRILNSAPIGLQVTLNGKMVSFQLPKGLTGDQIAELVSKFQ